MFYAVVFSIMASTFLSCSSGKSAKIRRIEREYRRNPPPTDMEATANATKDRKVRKAIKKQEQQKRDAAKAADDAERIGLKRHREAQTAETLKRMDENRKLSEKSNNERATQRKETYRREDENRRKPSENTGIKKEKKRKKK